MGDSTPKTVGSGRRRDVAIAWGLVAVQAALIIAILLVPVGDAWPLPPVVAAVSTALTWAASAAGLGDRRLRAGCDPVATAVAEGTTPNARPVSLDPTPDVHRRDHADDGSHVGSPELVGRGPVGHPRRIPPRQGAVGGAAACGDVPRLCRISGDGVGVRSNSRAHAEVES